MIRTLTRFRYASHSTQGWRLTKGLSLNLYCVCLLLLGFVQPLFGESETDSPVKEHQSDSAEVWSEKMSNKDTWENIVSFPGVVILFPLELTLDGLKTSIRFVSGKKIIPKTKDFLTSDDGRRGVRPTYSSRAGGGAMFFQKGLLSPQSKLTISAAAGLARRQRYELRMKRVALFGGALSSDYLVRYQLLSTESFFGLGPKSQREESNFAHEQVAVEASFGTGFSERISLDAILGFELNDISEGKDKSIPSTTEVGHGGTAPTENLPGLEEQVRMGRLQIGLRYDSRNRLGNHSNGNEASLTAGLFQDFDDDQFSFWRISADLTHYLHLFYNRTLALRLAGEINEPLSDGDIPFYYLSELGRQETIRGFSRGRFRDQDMVLASLEYRYPIWHVVDTMLFVDVGQVAHDIFNDLSQDNFEFGYGGGFRVWGDEGLISTFLIGKSRDGFRFYFTLN